MAGVRNIVDRRRFELCLLRLKRSDEFVVASCLEAAEALAALWTSRLQQDLDPLSLSFFVDADDEDDDEDDEDDSA